MNYNKIMTNIIYQEYELRDRNINVEYVVMNKNIELFLYDVNKEMFYNGFNGQSRVCGYKILIDSDLEDGEVEVVGNIKRGGM
jgi:hypothetical protein